MRGLCVVLVVGACRAGAPPAAPSNASRAVRSDPPPYDGVTSCGWSDGVTDAGFATGESTAMGSLDKNLISRPIKARSAAFAACYQTALDANPQAGGDVQAKFAILADGSVGQIEIHGFDRDLDRCVCAELLQLRYPKLGSARIGKVTVFYPFHFRPQP